MFALVGFSGLLASSALSLGYIRQKQKLCISLLSPMVPNLLSTFQSLLIFVLYIMLGF